MTYHSQYVKGGTLMTASIRTYLEADLKCYHCGNISGVTRVERGAGREVMTFKPLGSDVERPVAKREQLRCLRCNGPTFVDEWEVRHEYARIELVDDGRPRRGRPPKRLVEQRGAA
jgi:hypothetical protein